MIKCSSKLILLTIGGLILSNDISAQLTLNQPNTSGVYTAAQSITLLPGFSTGGNFWAKIQAAPKPAIVQNPSQNQNYIIENTFRTAGIVNTSQMQVLSADELQQKVNYFDGLGRPVQTILVQGSPNLRDVVLPVTYDPFGRETVKYNPYVVLPTSASDGSFKLNALADQSSFYNNPANPSTWNAPNVASTAFPYMETRFEPSPLNRIIEQGAVGDNWQLEGKSGANNPGHTLKTEYATNDAGSLGSGTGYWAKQYGVTIDDTGARTLIDLGKYEKNQLNVVITKDENWLAPDGKAGTTEEYKDKDGRIVLKRTFTATETFSTYYVYDDFDNLCFILPPKAEADSQVINSTILGNLCFQYRYDGNNRLIEKQIPGKAREYLVYNKIDQVVLSQDGNLSGQGKWLFNKYDALGRIVMTGILNNTSLRADLQNVVNEQTILWESPDAANGNGTGYTSGAYPLHANVGQYHVINYYDDYRVSGLPASYTDVSASNKTKGLLTASKINVIGTTNMLWAVNYYDDFGRAIKVFKQNYIGSIYSTDNYDEISSQYNFTNQSIQSLKIHRVNGKEVVRIENDYVYDHQGRKVRAREKINNASQWTVLYKDEYNELGQIMNHKLGADENEQNFLQAVAQNYNERGWLKSVSSSKLNLDLKYNNPDAGIIPQFNGNIAQLLYSGDHTGAKEFQYSYDKLSRLTFAKSTANTLNETLSYDKMGNLSELKRAGYGTLQYTIPSNSNQLSNISGFVNGAYTYDNNGNLHTDGSKGITVNFNTLNLVSDVSGSINANYTYDAQSNKLRSYISASGGTTTDYDGNIQYKNGQLSFISNEEGRAVRKTDGSYSYEYNLRDHQNNVRVSIDRSPSDQQTRVVQEDEYYPFGLRKPVYDLSNNNKYLYQNQEIQDGLNWYQFKYRMHDPVIGRFISVDPLAEKYEDNSVYAFSENKVTSHVELEGLEAVSIQLGGRATAVFFSASGGVGLILDKNLNLMPTANLQGGLGAGVGANGGVTLSVYPAAKSYSDLLGWGVAAGAMTTTGQDFSVNASIQTGGNDVRLGVSAGLPKIGVAAGGAGYLEMGKTWGLLDKPVNLKNLSAGAVKQIAKAMGLSVKQVKAFINTLKDTMPKPKPEPAKKEAKTQKKKKEEKKDEDDNEKNKKRR